MAKTEDGSRFRNSNVEELSMAAGFGGGPGDSGAPIGWSCREESMISITIVYVIRFTRTLDGTVTGDGTCDRKSPGELAAVLGRWVGGPDALEMVMRGWGRLG